MYTIGPRQHYRGGGGALLPGVIRGYHCFSILLGGRFFRKFPVIYLCSVEAKLQLFIYVL